MAQVLVTESYISDMASAIRSKNGQSASYTPSQMASAIDSIISAGALSIITKSISSNGSYSAAGDSVDAFSDVIVDVPNTYSSADEGKVVYSGELSAQGVLSVSANSIYDTTLISQVDVNVSGSAPVYVSKSITENGTYNPSDDDADAYSQVTVNVSGGGGGSNDNFLIAIGAKDGIVEDNEATKIGAFAFYGRSSGYGSVITGISADSVLSIGSSAFYNCNSLSFANFKLCEEIGNDAFMYCYELQNISFPSCTLIRSNAFYSCKKLGEAIFPHCVSIYSYGFYSCVNLSVISFPECTSISAYAFQKCEKLQEAVFPSCLSIRSYAFAGCKVLSSIYFPVCTSMESYVFNNDSMITEAYFPFCKNIGINTFGGCYRLSIVSFPVCEIVSNYAFSSCSALTEVEFPAAKQLGQSAFANCIHLTTASFPSVSYLQAFVFQNCVSLFSLYLLGSSVPNLTNSNTFQSTPMALSSYYGDYGSIFVPQSLVNTYKASNNWSYYSDRIVGV